MKEYLKQIGQGKSEYLIILAMIVIAGVAVYAIYNEKGRGEATDITSDTVVTPEPLTDP